MNKCDCYSAETQQKPRYDMYTGQFSHWVYEDIGRCNGTKERYECSCGGDRTKCNFYPEVREKALKDQEPKFGEWISVKDRLPENQQEVLICRGHHSGLMNTYIYCGNNEWEDDYGYWGRTNDEGITHWMPLPEPPTGLENKNV